MEIPRTGRKGTKWQPCTRRLGKRGKSLGIRPAMLIVLPDDVTTRNGMPKLRNLHALKFFEPSSEPFSKSRCSLWLLQMASLVSACRWDLGLPGL